MVYKEMNSGEDGRVYKYDMVIFFLMLGAYKELMDAEEIEKHTSFAP